MGASLEVGVGDAFLEAEVFLGAGSSLGCWIEGMEVSSDVGAPLGTWDSLGG